MGGAQGGDGLGASGGVHARGVSEESAAPGLVERRPGAHPVTQCFGGQGRVLGEALRGRCAPASRRRPPPPGADPSGRAWRPARCPWFSSSSVEPPVEVQPLLYGGTAAGGLDTGPGQGEPVRVDTEVGHDRDVLAPAVVVIGGDVPGVTVADLARGPGERVPDGGGASVHGGGAFDLVRGCRRAPGELLGESEGVAGPGSGCDTSGSGNHRGPSGSCQRVRREWCGALSP